MKSKLIIHAQGYENYNVDINGFNNYGDKKPHWKPKFGKKFFLEIDTDDFYYSTNSHTEILQSLLDKHETEAVRYEVVHYEFEYEVPEQLCTDEEFIDTVRAVNDAVNEAVSMEAAILSNL